MNSGDVTSCEPDEIGCISLCHGHQSVWQTMPDRAEILIPTEASLNLPSGNEQQLLRPPYDFFYLPAATILSRQLSYQGWRVQVIPDELCYAAVELSGYSISFASCRKRLKTIRALQPRLNPECEQTLMLQQLLKLSQSSILLHNRNLRQIGIDKLITRILALLLCGDLFPKPSLQSPPKQILKNQTMEDLTLWIRNNIHLQIQLCDLSGRTGYSERSLRNFFQERFQCGPIQWIRRQRLEIARDKLIQGGTSITVTGVAQSVGYSHLSQFSRDFQRHFGLRPSELVRKARSSQQDPPAAGLSIRSRTSAPSQSHSGCL
jgi:AraC-like DNA-binding protein